MSLLLKGGTCLLVGGGACAIPFLNFPILNKKTPDVAVAAQHSPEADNSHSSSSTSEDTSIHRNVEQRAHQTKNIVESTENCLYQYDADNSFIQEDFPSTRYFAFSCDNAGRHEEIIKSTWTIWLPETMLSDPDSFTEGKKINIKTQSEYLSGDSDRGDYYKTIFESDMFTNKSFTETWGGVMLFNASDSSFEEPPTYKVKITDQKLSGQVIYLKVKQ